MCQRSLFRKTRPAIAHCAKAIAECFIEIDTKKVAGAACKRALFYLAPLTGIIGVGVIVNLIDHPAAETITKVGANAAGLILTGPAYGFDCVLSPLELVIFGEPIPIVTDHRLLLFPISK